MAVKTIDIPEIGSVIFVRSARNKSIRITIGAKGPRVSLPNWTPYRAGVAFIEQNKEWVLAQLTNNHQTPLMAGTKIGKLHTLQFEQVPRTSTLRTTVTATRLIVRYHPNELPEHPAVQERAQKAALRALKREAEVVLPERVRSIAEKFNKQYLSVSVKQLKRRWGSCDSNQNLTLNLYLMQLSWQQIDYVICHELAHTVHMNHSAQFWDEVEQMLPDARMVAKAVRHTQPILVPRETSDTYDDDMAY